MPVPPFDLPPSFDHPVFTRAEALAAGISPDRLRRGDLVPITRGLYRRAGDAVSEEDIVAAYQRCVPGSFAMGLTAARIWHFPLPGALANPVVEPTLTARRSRSGRASYPARRRGPDSRIHLAVPGTARRSTSLIRWGRVLDGSVPLETVRGIDLTSRLHTYLQLGTSVSADALVAIGDHLVRRPRETFEGRRSAYATLEELEAAAAGYEGRGAARIRSVIKDVRVGADSPPETALRLAFIRAGLPEPLANVRIIDGGEDLGEPDLQWPEWKVIVEYEGPSHRSPEQRRKDAARDERRRLAGWVDLPMIAQDLAGKCASAVDRARTALRAQGWPG